MDQRTRLHLIFMAVGYAVFIVGGLSHDRWIMGFGIAFLAYAKVMLLRGSQPDPNGDTDVSGWGTGR